MSQKLPADNFRFEKTNQNLMRILSKLIMKIVIKGVYLNNLLNILRIYTIRSESLGSQHTMIYHFYKKE